MGLFAEELFEARMRANWYESAAMSETNFCAASEMYPTDKEKQED
jgi:hypothetical protein